MADEKTCTKCGKKLRVDNTKGFCGDSVACGKRAGRSDDAVLDGAAPTNWQEQFFRLAEVLGKNPEEMITAFCREWVEKTRAKALRDE